MYQPRVAKGGEGGWVTNSVGRTWESAGGNPLGGQTEGPGVQSVFICVLVCFH